MVMAEGVGEDAYEASQGEEMKGDHESNKELSSQGEVSVQIQMLSSGATLEDDLDTFMKCRGVDVPGGGGGGGAELGNGAAYTLPEITVSCKTLSSMFLYTLAAACTHARTHTINKAVTCLLSACRTTTTRRRERRQPGSHSRLQRILSWQRESTT
jgi:hypothetical protein